MFNVFVRNFNSIIKTHITGNLFRQKRFAGHSKWANIKHTKELKDRQKSVAFLKMAQNMRIAAIEGGSTNPANNLKLAQLVEQSKRINMPAATLNSILSSCEKDKSGSQTHIVDIKGPGGCVILCELFTPHLVKSRNNVQTILKKKGGCLGEGRRLNAFEHKGVVEVDIKDEDLNGILEKATNSAIEADAEDVKLNEETKTLQFLCAPTYLTRVTNNLEKSGYKIINSSQEYIPLVVVELNDEEIDACASIFEKLEALPEVVKLYDNIA